jgi:hypothetical protein
MEGRAERRAPDAGRARRPSSISLTSMKSKIVDGAAKGPNAQTRMARSARGENEAGLAGIIEFAVDLEVRDFEIEQLGA